MSEEEMDDGEDDILPDPDIIKPYSDFEKLFRDDGLWHCPGCEKWFDSPRSLRAHARPTHLMRWEPKPLDEKGKALKAFRSYEDMDVSDLKPWHRIAIFQNFVLGSTFAAIGRSLGRDEKVVSDLCHSPPAKRLAAELHEQLADNESLLRIIVGASAAGITIDDMTALQWAKEAEDYEFVHKFSMDYYKLAGIDKKGEGGGQSIVINLDTRSLEIPEVSVSHRIVVPDSTEADFEIVE